MRIVFTQFILKEVFFFFLKRCNDEIKSLTR